MAVLEVEVNEDGSIGKLPDQVQKFLDDKYREAFGKGAAKAAAEAQTQLQREIDKIKRTGGGDATLAEKASNLEAELSALKEQEAIRAKDFDEAKRLIAERHQKDLDAKAADIAARDKEIARRTERIKQLVTSDIKIAALKHGAREESLAELDVLLSRRVGLNDELLSFVADAEGKPALDKDGNPVTIEGLVQQYLTDHPHHKAAASGRGGRAAGGRSLAGDTGDGSEFAAAVDLVAQKPSVNSVADAFKRMGERKSA